MDLAQQLLQFMHDYRYFERNQPPCPPVKKIVIEHDKITFDLAEIPRRSFADGTRRPIINEFRIEWKEPKRSRWHTICTNSDNLLGFTLYLKSDKYKDRQTGLVNGHWHEYAFFGRLNQEYDVRVYAMNKSDLNIEPYTFTKLCLFENPPCRRFEDYCNTPPEILSGSADYLIGPAPNKSWSGYANYISQLNGLNPVRWIFLKPRKGWRVDDYIFNGTSWVDIKINTSFDALIKKQQSNDIIYEILQQSHINRICGDTRQERLDKLKELVFGENT